MSQAPLPLYRRLLPALLTAAVYFAAGELALWLAHAPGSAAPLYPAAGIALAAALVHGRWALPGVAVGAFAVNALLGPSRGMDPMMSAATGAVIAAGATLQAAAGAWLMKRRLNDPGSISEPRDALGLCLWGGAVACTISAGTAGLCLSQAGAVVGADVWLMVLTWWSGDTLGVLIATPIALTLIGQPAGMWRPRRLTVALPLVVVTSVLTLAILIVAGGDRQRGINAFDRDADQASDALASGLREPLFALEALRSLFIASERVTRVEFELAATAWLDPDTHLQALGFSQKVPRAQLAGFEAEVRADGVPDFQVFDRADADRARVEGEDFVVAVRHILPLAANRRALGVNAASLPPAREAIERSARTDAPATTGGFRLTQSGLDETGVVIYRSLFNGDPPLEPDERWARLRGVVFVTLRTGPMAEQLLQRTPAYLRWCLVDTDPSALRRRLAGPAGCEAAPRAPLQHARRLAFAGREWELRISAQSPPQAAGGQWTLWFFSVSGLLSVGMLSAVLLAITGRARRIEVAVNERTADLQREVQERERTEQALRDSERRFRNILDHLPLGVVYADLEGRLRETNPRLRELLGHDAKALRLRAIGDLIHPDDRQAVQPLIDRLVRGGPALVRHRLRLQRSDGREIWMDMGLSMLRNARGSAQRLVGVFEDITEHLKLADAERARESAEAASQAKSEFLSRMSHELRTPLNAILGFTQLVALDRQPAISERQREWTVQVQQAGWHLLHMIDEMLDLSRIEAGQLRLELGAVALAPVLRESLSLIEQDAQARQLKLQTLIDPSVAAVRADPLRLKQILINLLSNAVKYNVDGGQLHVAVRRVADGRVAVAVSDTGLGLESDQLERLFEPFNRLGREQSRTEGTGLGLAISRRLAELMGGRLEAVSQARKGSTFTLTLPEADAAAAGVRPVPGEASTEPTYRYRQVHYIEDNETNAEVMRGILAQRPQVRLSVSDTGGGGLAAIRAEPPSLVLLDMHLPDMDGLDVLRELRSDPALADIPVIVVSADATTSRIEQAFAEGATEYTTKPVDVGSFLSQLDSLLDRQDTRFG